MTAREFCRLVEKGEATPGTYVLERYSKPTWKVIVEDANGTDLAVVDVDEQKREIVMTAVAGPRQSEECSNAT